MNRATFLRLAVGALAAGLAGFYVVTIPGTISASVLGPERGMKLIDDAKGVAGLLVRKPGDAIEFIESREWKAMR